MLIKYVTPLIYKFNPIIRFWATKSYTNKKRERVALSFIGRCLWGNRVKMTRIKSQEK